MLMNALTFFIGLAGAALIAFGAWLVYEPAGYITGGFLCLGWSFMAARAIAVRDLTQREKGSS
jgi:hypothetical protein